MDQEPEFSNSESSEMSSRKKNRGIRSPVHNKNPKRACGDQAGQIEKDRRPPGAVTQTIGGLKYFGLNLAFTYYKQ
jgi:hypothetical protein